MVAVRALIWARLFSHATQLSAPRVAVVGSGPAGLFTCSSLLRKSSKCVIDVFDASPVPFGLVRYGVAPDHQEVKNCIHGFEKTFNNHPNQMNLFCNVRVGQDVLFKELCENYDAIVLAYGAHRPRRLDIPGATSENVLSGSDFVSWYNGVPNARSPNLDGENVVIIGNGNVALDCARILSSRTALQNTDIPDAQLEMLLKSKTRNISIVGRRGPADISFTIKELREQFKVPFWSSFAVLSESEGAALDNAIATGDRRRKRLLQVLKDHSALTKREGNLCHFLFNRIPTEVLKNSGGRVEGVRFKSRFDNKVEDIPCDLLIYSIGYENIILDGLPTNEKGSIRLTDSFRVDFDECAVFACGWCAHGPHGVIVDTQQESVAVAAEIATVLENVESKACGVKSLLDARGICYVTWSEWKEIDAREKEMGQKKGKVREKITHFEDILRHRRE